MTYRYKVIALLASGGVITLFLPPACSQTVPAINASYTMTQNQYCSSDSAWGLSISYTGNYSATCY
jgi:hypothetical protein